MAERYRTQAAGGSSGLGSAVAGALIGAAGLAWWLLSEAERRRDQGRHRSSARMSRLDVGVLGSPNPPLQERELHHKVQELNQAIESVRRQLEQL
jgi:hypothetical protein